MSAEHAGVLPLSYPSETTSVAVKTAPGGAVQRISDELMEEIRSGRTAPGSWLRQESLAARFGVSRQPVREALRTLEAAGLVELVPNRGALVLSPSLRDVREMFALRAQLEGFAAELAAIQRERHHLDLLDESLHMFADASDARWEAGGPIDERWRKANALLHSTVIEASGNQRLALALADVEKSVPDGIVLGALSRSPREVRLSMLDHQGIVEAIRSRDSTLARLRTIQHVRTAGDLVIAALSSDLRDH